MTKSDQRHEVYLDVIEVAPDGVTHTYWSTHCRHALAYDRPELHDLCKADELAPGVERKPSQCKHAEACGARCICPCHNAAESAPTDLEETVMDHDDITHAQARAEALRRLREADRLYAEWRALPPEERTADHLIMLDACQMRQTAIGYAALGGGGL